MIENRCFILILAFTYLENLEVSHTGSDNEYENNIQSANIYM